VAGHPVAGTCRAVPPSTGGKWPSLDLAATSSWCAGWVEHPDAAAYRDAAERRLLKGGSDD